MGACSFVAVLLGSLASPSEPAFEGALWELRALGVADEGIRGRLMAIASRRPVTVAVVGLGGVSQKRLEGVVVEYRAGAGDPGAETHDTSQVRVAAELMKLVGVRARWLVYQPPQDFEAVGRAFREAAKEADIVVCYHSFWGPGIKPIVEATRESGRALFVAPYAEYGGLPTGTCWQAHALKPDGSGIPHFVTCIPMARNSPGVLLRPLARDERDSETINFVVPSYYANGPGGTCPAASTAVAVAAFVFAASPSKPSPPEVVRILSETATVDEGTLLSLPEFDEVRVRMLKAEIERLRKQGKLATSGILSLGNILRRLG